MIISDKQNYKKSEPMIKYRKAISAFYKSSFIVCCIILVYALSIVNPLFILLSSLLSFASGFMLNFNNKKLEEDLKEHHLTIAQYKAIKKQLKIENRLEKIKSKTAKNQENIDKKYKKLKSSYDKKSLANSKINDTVKDCEKILTLSTDENIKENIPLIKKMIDEVKNEAILIRTQKTTYKDNLSNEDNDLLNTNRSDTDYLF